MAPTTVHDEMPQVTLILNPHAGALRRFDPEQAQQDVSATLAAAGIHVNAKCIATARDLKSIVDRVTAERPDAVVVGGGDGTISTAAAGLTGTGIPMGVLPLGTLNHFARDLALPPDWREAVRTLAGMRVGKVDVGEVNGRVFINNCSLGAYPAAVRRRDVLRRQRGTRKWTAMFVASLGVFCRLRTVRVRLRLREGERSLRAPFLVVANNRYSGHVLDGSLRQRLDERKLWIYTTRAQRRWALLRLAWQSLVQRIDLADDLETWAAEDFSIEIGQARGRVPVAIDGEISDLAPPLRFQIRPGALSVIFGSQPEAQ